MNPTETLNKFISALKKQSVLLADMKIDLMNFQKSLRNYQKALDEILND